MRISLKQHSALWVLAFAGAMWVVMGDGPRSLYAQKTVLMVPTPTSQAEQAIQAIDAQRGALDRFLDAHPEIADVVFSNPSVMTSPGYLRSEPALEAFLESHPVVKADPRAFISPGAWRYQYHRSQHDELLGYFVPFTAFICFLVAAAWVLHTLVENRRWNRSFKAHEDVHTKLIEKFASAQELTAYMQSDAGRRLLEWTPPGFETPTRSLPAAVGRIISSSQAGLIMLLLGLGLLILIPPLPAESKPTLLVFGTLGVTVGAAFILSALVAFRLSKHLGLIVGPPGSSPTSNP
jgi:hypothetical protein